MTQIRQRKLEITNMEMWYAILGPDGKELSGRWAEAQQMMALVREIWDRC